jgi:hypothetical protein
MLAKIARLAGLGAYGAIAGMSAGYGLFVNLTMPTRTTGIDMTNALVAWIGVGGVLLALIALHMVLAKQLLRLGQGLDKRHPL